MSPTVVETETFVLRDGRKLVYGRYGETQNAAKFSVFYFNGTPGSHPECGLLDSSAQKLGILLIGTDRPGFGESDWQDSRELLQWPSDVLELADHLHLSKFGVVGLSGGGPHALACLHSLPRERLVAATVISGMWPVHLGTSAMMWQSRLMFGIARWSTWLLEKVIDMTLARTLRADDMAKLKAMIKLQNDSLPVPQADKDVMDQMCSEDSFISSYLLSSRRAVHTSSRGAAWELWLVGSEWRFRLEDLDGSRLTMWHGGQDINVPASMADQASKLIPGVKYERLDDQGHVSLIVKHGETILEELAERLAQQVI